MMKFEDYLKKRHLEEHIQNLQDMRDVMLNDENWENMGHLIEACTAGAMAIKRVIKEDFGESEGAECQKV